MRNEPEHIWIHLLTNHTLFFFLSHSFLLFLLLFLFPSHSLLISCPSLPRSHCHLSSPLNPSLNSTATDLQFARTTEGHPVPFATAGDCYSAAKCPQVGAGSLPWEPALGTRGSRSWECIWNNCSEGSVVAASGACECSQLLISSSSLLGVFPQGMSTATCQTSVLSKMHLLQW